MASRTIRHPSPSSSASGTHTSTQGAIEPLWEAQTWGVVAEEAENGLTDFFRLNHKKKKRRDWSATVACPSTRVATAVIYESTPAPTYACPKTRKTGRTAGVLAAEPSDSA